MILASFLPLECSLEFPIHSTFLFWSPYFLADSSLGFLASVAALLPYLFSYLLQLSLKPPCFLLLCPSTDTIPPWFFLALPCVPAASLPSSKDPALNLSHASFLLPPVLHRLFSYTSRDVILPSSSLSLNCSLALLQRPYFKSHSCSLSASWSSVNHPLPQPLPPPPSLLSCLASHAPPMAQLTLRLLRDSTFLPSLPWCRSPTKGATTALHMTPRALRLLSAP